MTGAIKFCVALCAWGALGAAQGSSGYLVDRKCFEALERNVNPFDADRAVNRDLGFQIRYCHPRTKTQSFIFIQQNGLNFQLDAAGDRKAADLVRVNKKKAADLVNVMGQKSGHTIHVTSISVSQ